MRIAFLRFSVIARFTYKSPESLSPFFFPLIEFTGNLLIKRNPQHMYVYLNKRLCKSWRKARIPTLLFNCGQKLVQSKLLLKAASEDVCFSVIRFHTDDLPG